MTQCNYANGISVVPESYCASAIYAGVASGGSDTITVTLSSQESLLWVEALEVSGITISLPATGTGMGTGSPSTFSTSSTPIASAGDLGCFALSDQQRYIALDTGSQFNLVSIYASTSEFSTGTLTSSTNLTAYLASASNDVYPGGLEAGALFSTTSSASASDTATLSGGYGTMAGSVTFTVYSDGSCSDVVSTLGPITVTSTGPGAAAAAASGSFTPPSTGTFYWEAAFTDTDGNNNGATTVCGGGGETLTGNVATPTLVASDSPATLTLNSSPIPSAPYAVICTNLTVGVSSKVATPARGTGIYT